MKTLLSALIAAAVILPAAHAATIHDPMAKKDLKVLDAVAASEIVGVGDDLTLSMRLSALAGYRPNGNPWASMLQAAGPGNSARLQVMLAEQSLAGARMLMVRRSAYGMSIERSSRGLASGEVLRDFLGSEHLLPTGGQSSWQAVQRRKVEVAPAVAALERAIDARTKEQPIAQADLDALEFVVPVAPILRIRDFGGKLFAITEQRIPGEIGGVRGSREQQEILANVEAVRLGPIVLHTGIQFQGVAIPDLRQFAAPVTCYETQTVTYQVVPMAVASSNPRDACGSNAPQLGRLWLGVVGHMLNVRATDGHVKFNTAKAVLIDIVDRKIVASIAIPASVGDYLDYSREFIPAVHWTANEVHFGFDKKAAK